MYRECCGVNSILIRGFSKDLINSNYEQGPKGHEGATHRAMSLRESVPHRGDAKCQVWEVGPFSVPNTPNTLTF